MLSTNISYIEIEPITHYESTNQLTFARIEYCPKWHSEENTPCNIHAIYKLNRLLNNNVSKLAIFITCLFKKKFLVKVVVDF